MSTNKKSSSGMEKFQGYWREWKEGGKAGIFNSIESIGVGHTKLWRFLISERRLWRRHLQATYGFNVRSGKFAKSARHNKDLPIPALTKRGALYMPRECLRHHFYQALEQYLVVCECLQQCGDPPELLANLFFWRYAERSPILFIAGDQHVKQLLLWEMRQTSYIPGETYGEYLDRPHKRFRSQDMSSLFDMVYLPLTKILDPESGPDGDTALFFGAFADTGISLTKDVRLKAALKLDGADPYDSKHQLLPSVVMNKVVPQLMEIADQLKRETAFRKLPSKAAYALGQVVGVVPKKSKRPPTVEPSEDATSDEASLHQRVAREQISNLLSPRRSEFQEDQRTIMDQRLAKLSARQREVYVLHEDEELNLEEIGQQLNIAQGTAATHYWRAKAKMKEMQKR